MREILFRAFSMCRGEHWVYGQPRHYARNPHTEKWTIYDPNTGIETDIDEETIGQYTGLEDKNGRKIFEGDIVRRNEHPFNLVDIGTVVYNESIGSFRLNVEKNGFPKWYDFVSSDVYRDGYCTVDCKATFEVIGNKFDNYKTEGGEKRTTI